MRAQGDGRERRGRGGRCVRERAGLLVGCWLMLAAVTGRADAQLDAVLADPAADAVARGRAVAEAADRADDGFGDSRVAVRMVLHDGRGARSERELRLRTLEGDTPGTDRSLIVFDSPADQRGTALLTWNTPTGDDDQWLFLPVLERVKKIAARNRSGPFVGSEFAFEDLTADAVSRFGWRYLDRAPCDPQENGEGDPAGSGLACHRVERVPVDDWSGYSRQVAFYDVDALRLVRVEYHDRKGELLKTLVASDWVRDPAGWWRARVMDMRNHQTGRRTELLWDVHAFDTGLAERDFTPTALRRIR